MVIVTVVVASEPPRLCKPGEWSDNAATRFTVLYHPFCLSPLYPRSLARALAPFHTICNFPATLRLSPVFPSHPNRSDSSLSTFLSTPRLSLSHLCARRCIPDGCILRGKSSRSDYHRQMRGSKHCRQNSTSTS